MSEVYCAKVENGIVTQVIVCGDPAWASQSLGGEWVCTDARLVGVGWQVLDGEIVEPTPEPIDPAAE